MVAAVCVAAAVAEPVSSLKPAGYVNDFASVLSEATKAQLEEICRQVDEKANAQIAVVTVKSTDGEEIFNYSVDLYQKWGIGKKGTDRGVLILLAVNDRRRSIRVGYGLEPILPDGKVGGFGREAVPYLQRGDYDGAVSLLTSRVADVIAHDAGVEITTSQPRRIAPLEEPPPQTHLSPGKIIALIIIVIIALAVRPLRQMLFYMFLFGGGGGGSRGGWSGGGGFGGGGGGFGGFGGGSTGGGGADGSW